MSHTVSSKMQPSVMVTISDAEYELWLQLGIVYEGVPVPATTSYLDMQVAELVDRLESATRAELRALMGADAGGLNDGVIAALVPGPSSTATALRAAFVPKWKPSTAYASGEFVLNPSGQIVSANTAFTSGTTYSASNWTLVSGGGGTASTLTPTATKTAPYTAAVGDLAMMNVAGGAITLTLPAAPADKAQVGYRAIGATNAVPLTINRGGADTIGTTGATTASILLADETVILQYDAANTRWLGVANVRTQASVDARYIKQDVGAQALSQRIRRLSGLPAQPIASGGGAVPNNPSPVTPAVGMTARSAYKAAVSCTDIQLVFPLGFYLLSGTGNVAETAIGTATLPNLKVAIEAPNGTIYPVFFRGSRLVSIDPWGVVTSDPIALELNAGDVFYVRSYLPTGTTTTTNIPMPRSYPAHGPGVTISGTVGYTTAGDVVDAGGTFTSDLTYAYMAPIVCGQPTGTPAPTIGVVGDSITGGVGSLNGSSSWWKYGLNNAFPTVQYDRAGITAQGIAAAHRYGFPLLGGLSHALVLLGTNDFQGRTLAQMQADLTTIWTALANRGSKVYGATIPPLTTSTDSFATTANQTKKATEGIRTGFNDWIRTLPAPLTGFMEIADVCETARNSGLWKVNGTANYATADGTHPSDAFHQLMGATIPVSSLTI